MPAFLVLPDFVIPRHVWAAVKDNKVGFVCTALVGIASGLLYTFADGGFQRFVEDFEFQHDALYFTVIAFFLIHRPFDEQVGAFSA